MRTALRAGVYDLAPTAIDRPAFDARRFALLERIARGEPLPELLRGVVRLIEDEAPGMLGSIVLFADGRISAAVGDSLPPAFRDALSGLAIGPRAGSCGTAAYLNQRVIVDDISSHEYWTDYRAMAEPFGLRACWSSPIHLPERGVVASFAMYYRERRSPTSDEIRLIDEATCLTAVAIQRDLADRELRASEERLRAVIEHSPNVCIQWYDADARMLFANDASRRLFGWARGSEVGRRLDELNFPPAAAARFQQAVAAVHATGQPQGPMEFEFAHPDGGTGVLLSTVFRIPLAGDTFCCACMDVDLTEHRRLEHAARADERLRALVYSMVADVIFYVGIEDGPRYRFLCVNDAFLRATGLTEADVVGKWVDEVIPPPALPLVLERYAEAVRTGQPVTWDEESRYPAGVKRGEVTVAPVVDGNGRCTHLIGTVHDVTERVAAVEERRQLEQQLHRAQRLQSLGTFAGGIAHDFNNLLNAIRGYADLALADVEDPAASTGSLVEITRTTSRASDLVRRILLFSRGETPNLEPVAAAPLLEEAIRLIRVNLPPRITVEHPAMSQLPPMLADATQVHQVLMNLLTNAVQAMGDAGGVIAISCDTIAMDQGLEPDLRPGRYVRISVHDNGCGMDPLTQARIFEPFFTTKSAQRGTGLGLSVVHGIMRAHRGAVTVDSEPGRGTTFELYFPVAMRPADERRAVAADPEGRRRIHVLYVDDDEALVTLTDRALSRMGYRVSAYVDAVEALEAFRAAPDSFSIVVTDTSMPTLSGIELIAAVRRIRADIPVLLLTGYIRTEDADAAAAAGLPGVLLKPHTVQALGELVDAHIRTLSR